ncbi:MAG: HAD family hydrolase [Kiritimatiellaeota bacterium]|nr:HAD family hydrolase [Kiritimatiellota bacterium]
MMDATEPVRVAVPQQRNAPRDSRKAVFLDRDGTLVADRGYLADPEGIELLPGVAEGLAALLKAGFLLVVVTNQSGVGRGMFPMTAVEAQHQRLKQLLTDQHVELAGIEVCPHCPEDHCDCRKPAPGMLLRAARRLHLDLDSSFLVGDKCSDIQAGAAVGCRGVLVGADTGDCPLAEARFSDFGGVVAWILRRNAEDTGG